jgi:GTPase
MKNENHLKGDLYLYPTFPNGRRNPVREGYRPSVTVGEFSGSLCIKELNTDWLEPSEEALVEMQFLAPEGVRDQDVVLKEGDILEVCEGSQAVGELTILEVNL